MEIGSDREDVDTLKKVFTQDDGVAKTTKTR